MEEVTLVSIVASAMAKVVMVSAEVSVASNLAEVRCCYNTWNATYNQRIIQSTPAIFSFKS
jgi:hypothetical protein